MSFLTGLALQRRSVTILVIMIVLVGGILTYNRLPVELFPEIEFPLITVHTFYPSADPETVLREVTEPIEKALMGIDGLQEVQSVSTEDRSLVLGNFVFGTDMAEAERNIVSNLSGISFPDGAEEPQAGRISPDAFPVLQLSIVGERDISELQAIAESLVLPEVRSVEGVFSVDLVGAAERQVVVTVDPDRLLAHGVSMVQVSKALADNNVAVPTGAITADGQTFPIRATHTYGSMDDLRDLVVGFSPAPVTADPPGGPPADDSQEPQAVLLSDVASVAVGAGRASSVSRTNGKPSVGVAVVKEPDANTVEVTGGVLANLRAVEGLPPDVEIVTISDDGPEIQAQVDTLEREALFGFLFAITVVFLFLITVRPTVLKGLRLTVRPTVVIGLSIPLSILAGILLMASQGMSLNLMTLGGLAISVGRVVDDSIVVLENVYRHIQRGEDRMRVALEATKEVGPAIIASTLTTIVVFVPLAFIKGLVGAFFLPFAVTVSFALAASLLVSLTAVPVLGAMLIRPGDYPSVDGAEGTGGDRETWMQRAYTPMLVWALRHKAATLVLALMLTAGSLGLIGVIPITLFPTGGERFLVIGVALPPGASAERLATQVGEVESTLARLSEEGVVEVYQTTIGVPANLFGPGAGPTGFGGATMFIRLSGEAPENLAESLRAELGSDSQRTVTVTEIGSGPPVSDLEMSVTGNDYGAISSVARRLVGDIGDIDGIINVSSDVIEARDEIVLNVDPGHAAGLGLTARDVATQVSQFMVGQQVTQASVDGAPTQVFLRGRVDPAGGVSALRELAITGPLGSAPLKDVAEVGFEKAPVTISRYDRMRSASITGSITAKDTQAIGREVQSKVDAIDLPAGVEVITGGIFRDIAEGFQAIFLAMGAGVLLVYLVMVGALGNLRNPFVIVMSLPLALIGALAALAITGRTLGLPALMGLLLLIGIVVTNAVVLVTFVEQLRERGLGVHEALVEGGRVRLRPILMTAFTTSFALLPLAVFVSEQGALIGAELATVVIGGLASSTFLTLIVIPVVYTLLHVSVPGVVARAARGLRRAGPAGPALATAEQADGDS